MENNLLKDLNKPISIKLSGEKIITTRSEMMIFSQYISKLLSCVNYKIDTLFIIIPIIKFTTEERQIIEECLSIISRYIDVFNELGEESNVLNIFRLFEDYIKNDNK